jgi:hypothetical protein
VTVVRGDDNNCVKSLRFEHNSPHWEGHWVGHLHLPLECNKDEEVVVLGANRQCSCSRPQQGGDQGHRCAGGRMATMTMLSGIAMPLALAGGRGGDGGGNGGSSEGEDGGIAK